MFRTEENLTSYVMRKEQNLGFSTTILELWKLVSVPALSLDPRAAAWMLEVRTQPFFPSPSNIPSQTQASVLPSMRLHASLASQGWCLPHSQADQQALQEDMFLMKAVTVGWPMQLQHHRESPRSTGLNHD